MSKIERMRSRLASVQKDREDFERQKRELEEQMNVGRKNMDKIQKGLKNNVILNDPEFLDTKTDIISPKRMSKRDMKSFIANGANMAGASGTLNSTGTLPTSNEALQAQVIIPSGPRISEWCFTGPLDSAPPVVKSREMYENIRLLGRGAFGEVNLVKNIEDNKLFAIKTIFCSKDAEFDNVLREIRFLRGSRHPCIVDVHDSFITSNPRVVHIVMHYCESGSLASVISSAKKTKTFIAEAQVVKWLVQLALALNFLHERKTLHRDMKPMNVMLTEGGDLLKVADFGLAMNIEDNNQATNVDEAGTPYYTAPEMITRSPYSFPADCWSLGVILHQLLELERPFEGGSTADLVKAILTAEPPALPAHYSEEIRSISARLLEKSPAQRLSMRQMLCEPSLFPKAVNFPQIYRPRNLEERIRRTHLRLLEQQIELVQRARRASAVPSSSALSAAPSEPSSPSVLLRTLEREGSEGEGEVVLQPLSPLFSEPTGDGKEATSLSVPQPSVAPEREGERRKEKGGEEEQAGRGEAVAATEGEREESGEASPLPNIELGEILQMSERLLQEREGKEGQVEVEVEVGSGERGGRKGGEIQRAIAQDQEIESVLGNNSE